MSVEDVYVIDEPVAVGEFRTARAPNDEHCRHRRFMSEVARPEQACALAGGALGRLQIPVPLGSQSPPIGLPVPILGLHRQHTRRRNDEMVKVAIVEDQVANHGPGTLAENLFGPSLRELSTHYRIVEVGDRQGDRHRDAANYEADGLLPQGYARQQGEHGNTRDGCRKQARVRAPASPQAMRVSLPADPTRIGNRRRHELLPRRTDHHINRLAARDLEPAPRQLRIAGRRPARVYMSDTMSDQVTARPATAIGYRIRYKSGGDV